MSTFFKTVTSSHFGKSFLITLFGSGSAKIISVLTTFIVARLLTQDDFGQFSFVRTTLEMILSICALNFSELATKYTTEISAGKPYHKLLLLFIFSFSICLILGLLMNLLPESLLLEMFINKEIVGIFRYVGCLLPLLFIAPLIQGVYRGLFNFKFVAKVQIWENVFFLIVSIIFIIWKGLIGAFFAILIYYVFRSLIVLIPLCQQVNLKKICSGLKGIIVQKYILAKEILPMFMMSFVDAPILWLAQYLLTLFGGFTLVASMTVVMQIRNLILIVPSYFFSTFTSFASKLFVEKKYIEYFKKFDSINAKLLFVSLGAIVILGLMGKFLLGLFGSEYKEAIVPFLFGIIPLPLLLIISVIKIHMVIRERQKNLLYISIIWNALWLILFFLFMKFNILSSLNAFFLCQDIAVVVQFIYLYYIYKKDKQILLA